MNISPKPKQTLIDFKEIRKKEINNYRDSLLKKPILFNNTYFDTDSRSLMNLSYWHLQLNSGKELPEGFVWRDFYNIDIPANSEFIKDLSLAITEKGTNIYKTSWIHKANIDNLSSFEEVKNYNIEENWP